MSTAEDFEAVILGTGEAGKFLAWHLGALGKRVAVIERSQLGGACPNVACLPSKNVIHTAKVASYVRRSEEFGITRQDWEISMSGVRDRKREMVADLQEIHRANFAKSGAEILMGTGRFIAERTLEVSLNSGGTRLVHGQQVFLDTGTRASVDDTPGLRESNPLTHVEALELDTLPDHLLILGGGYIGLEFAQAMKRFGSRVTVVERSARLLPREDADVSEALWQLCQAEGIEVVTGATVNRVSGRSADQVKVHLTREGSEMVLEGSHLLVAAGRTPNTDDIGLDVAGVKTTDRGYIQVNARLGTSASNVWAMGDCAGSPHFTHISFDDFRIVRDNLTGGQRTTTDRQVPFCLYTDPELARVGLNESEAKQQGVAYRTAKIPMSAVLRTRTLSETTGFLKALVGQESDKIIGFTGFGTGAGELLPVVQLAMSAGLPYTALGDLILTHPTIGEGIGALFSAVPRRS